VNIGNKNKGVSAVEGMACSYRIRGDTGDNGQQLILRIRNIKGIQIYANVVEG
jgi:hypothetical protein